MKESALKIGGILLISLGILGFLLLGTNILGYAISEEESNYLSFGTLEDITIREDKKETIDIPIKNLGSEEITNCKLLTSGEGSEWLSNTETKNLASNSEDKFIIEVNTPEKVIIDEYPIELTLTCDQDTITDKFSILLTRGVDAIKIREMKSEKNNLNLIYTFNNEGFIGETTFVEIWVKNPDGFEVNRIKDQFPINTDKLIVRNINIDLKENPKGVYNVFFSHPSDKESYIKKSVILGKSSTTGNAVFNVADGKGLPYLAFLLFIAIGVFFIFRSHKRAVQAANEPISTSPKLKPIK